MTDASKPVDAESQRAERDAFLSGVFADVHQRRLKLRLTIAVDDGADDVETATLRALVEERSGVFLGQLIVRGLRDLGWLQTTAAGGVDAVGEVVRAAWDEPVDSRAPRLPGGPMPRDMREAEALVVKAFTSAQNLRTRLLIADSRELLLCDMLRIVGDGAHSVGRLAIERAHDALSSRLSAGSSQTPGDGP